MNQGKLVLAQLNWHLPLTTFRRGVARYQGNREIKSYSCFFQFPYRAFKQPTYRDSLRDIEACLRARQAMLYHPAFRSLFVVRNSSMPKPWRLEEFMRSTLEA